MRKQWGHSLPGTCTLMAHCCSRRRPFPVSCPKGSTAIPSTPATSKVADASKSSEARRHLPHTSSSHCRGNGGPVSPVTLVRGQEGGVLDTGSSLTHAILHYTWSIGGRTTKARWRHRAQPSLTHSSCPQRDPAMPDHCPHCSSIPFSLFPSTSRVIETHLLPKAANTHKIR